MSTNPMRAILSTLRIAKTSVLEVKPGAKLGIRQLMQLNAGKE